MANACDSGSHHSALYHYNRSEAVLVAQLQRLRPYTSKTGTKVWKFLVQTTYKTTDTLVSPSICYIHIPEGPAVLLQRRQRYLLYLTPQRGDPAWQCERPLAASDSTAQQQLAVLQQLSSQHDGWVEERSPYGRVWAAGRLQGGQPVGVWHYYAYSGELKLRGQHGRDTALWEQFHHTLDANYAILHQIYTGAYQAQTGEYQVIAWDTLATGLHCYQLQYKVGADTLTERLVYRARHIEQRSAYQGGWRHGLEERYNTKGECIRRYHFEQGALHGPFWERQTLPQGRTGYVEIDGYYHNDEKQTERHRYYRADRSVEREVLLMEDGKVVTPLIE